MATVNTKPYLVEVHLRQVPEDMNKRSMLLEVVDVRHGPEVMTFDCVDGEQLMIPITNILLVQKSK